MNEVNEWARSHDITRVKGANEEYVSDMDLKIADLAGNIAEIGRFSFILTANYLKKVRCWRKKWTFCELDFKKFNILFLVTAGPTLKRASGANDTCCYCNTTGP